MCRPFGSKPGRADVPAAEVDVTVLEPEHPHHAVGVEEEAAAHRWRPRRIGGGPVIGAAQRVRHRALDHLQAADLALRPHRAYRPAKPGSSGNRTVIVAPPGREARA
jgi:hypothetical protein